MAKKIIRFWYRKIINASSQSAWERYVFESTYKEFLMQAQFYNQGKKYTSFAELIIYVPDAEKLHFLVSASLVGYLRQLNEVMPDILNNLGKHFLKFTDYRFEIINSDVKDKTKHHVAINFFSQPLYWHDTVDTYIVVSGVNGEKNADGILTDMVQLRPFFSIYSLKYED